MTDEIEIKPNDGMWGLDVIATLIDLIRAFPPTEKASYSIEYAPEFSSNKPRIQLEHSEFVLWHEDELPEGMEEIVRSIALLYGWDFEIIQTDRKTGEMKRRK